MSANKLLFQFAKPYPVWIALTVILGFSGALFNGVSTTLIVPLILNFIGQNQQIKEGPFLIQYLMKPFDNLPENYQLLALTSTVIFVIILKNLTNYTGVLVSSALSRAIVSDLRSAGVRLLLDVDLDYYSKAKIGDVINQLGGEIARTASAISLAISIFTHTITVFLFICLLVAISWKLTLISTIMLVFVYKINQYFINRAQVFGQQLSQMSAGYSVRLLETLNGMRLIKGTANEEREYQKLLTLIKTREQADFQAQANFAAIGPINEVLSIIIVVFIVICGRLLFAHNIDSFIPLLLTYLFLLFRTLPLISQLNSTRSRFANASCSVQIVEEFLQRFKIIDHSQKKRHQQSIPIVASPHITLENYQKTCLKNQEDLELIWCKPFMKNGYLPYQSLQEGIRFENISFSYSSQDSLVLQDINLFLPKGKTLALVGSSGSGKSTLADLLTRFYDPTQGRITLDNIDLRDFDLNSIRQVMGIVSQDTFLFNTSVRENIAYAKPGATEKEIIMAAKRANAYEFIENLDDGLETKIGDRGVLLSGGQRQRIAIARALLQNPEILILDEATSALDTVSERLVQEAIEQLSFQRTTLVIAHRLSTVQKADQIAVLDRGRIVEVGTHQNLLNKEGYYAKLYSLQFAQEMARDEALMKGSYEVRTRLTPMIGFLKLLVDNLIDSEEEHDELVKESYHSATHILKTIEFMENTVKRKNHD